MYLIENQGSKGESEIALNGDIGDTGLNGIRGIQGDIGNKGNIGTKGFRGEQGKTQANGKKKFVFRFIYSY